MSQQNKNISALELEIIKINILNLFNADDISDVANLDFSPIIDIEDTDYANELQSTLFRYIISMVYDFKKRNEDLYSQLLTKFFNETHYIENNYKYVNKEEYLSIISKIKDNNSNPEEIKSFIISNDGIFDNLKLESPLHNPDFVIALMYLHNILNQAFLLSYEDMTNLVPYINRLKDDALFFLNKRKEYGIEDE